MNLRPHQQAILGATVVAALSTVVPFLNQLFLPVLYLDTHIHELCHAIVGMATGGEVSRILVHGDGSGVTYIAGGNPIFDASAGYLGATIIGALTIYFSQNAKSSKITLGALAIALGFSMLVFVRGDVVGVISGFGWIAALWGFAQFLNGFWLLFIAQLLGLLQCLNAVQALYELLQISGFREGTFSDAVILQQNTGIPAIFWALLWAVTGLGLVGFTLHRAWVNPSAVDKVSSRLARK